MIYKIRLPITKREYALDTNCNEPYNLVEAYRVPSEGVIYRFNYKFLDPEAGSEQDKLCIVKMGILEFDSGNTHLDGKRVSHKVLHIRQFLVAINETPVEKEPFPNISGIVNHLVYMRKRALKELENTVVEEENISMKNRFQTGDRVIYHGNTATVLGPSTEQPGTVIVVTDRINTKTNQAKPSPHEPLVRETHLPYKHLVLIPKENLKKNIKTAGPWHAGVSRFQSWKNCPSFIGVLVKSSFVMDDILFEAGSTGNLVRTNRGADYAYVRWHHTHSSFESYAPHNKRLYAVPLSKLQMVTLGPAYAQLDDGPWDVLAEWAPFGAEEDSYISQFNKGDIVTLSNIGTRVSLPKSLRGRSDEILLEIVSMPSPLKRNSLIQCLCLSGVPVEALGSTFNVPIQHLKRFKHAFISSLTKVEVVAEVVFRKQTLLGKKATVVLPTDIDGDVGVEFEEDMNAGNLDGAGEDGRCLYIQSSALKVSE